MFTNLPAVSLRSFIASVFVLGLTSGALADDRDPSFRAFWADAFSQGFKSTSQINSMVSRAVAGNYNAIIAEVLAYQDNVGGGHGAYWNSSIVPKATDIVGGIDPLAYLVSQAHANGLEVHAWLVTYRVSTSWPPSGNSLLAAHPEWLMVRQVDMGSGPLPLNDGNPLTTDKYTLDPGSPDVQEYLVSIVQELVTNYAIDGINWDYIRYTQVDAGYPTDESYTKSSLARFRDLTWYSGTPSPTGVTSWNNFRRRTIDELVRRCRVEIPSITSNPRQPLRLTADLITFGNAPTYFSNSEAYQLHQNWESWMARGYLDAGIPMNYKREHEADEAQWYRNWIDACVHPVTGWRHDRHLFCGQANYLNTKANSVTQLQYGITEDADGSVNYSYYDTADENMNGTPETDWTWYTYVSDHLFTSTVPAPDMPWRDPATATEGTLWGQVTDPATGDPIDGASIKVDGLASVDADGNGYYVVTLIPAAPGGTAYDITANKYGCSQRVVHDVAVLPGEVVRQDVDLCDTSLVGDMDEDGDVDTADLPYFLFCLQGPDHTYIEGNFCLNGDVDADMDIDLADFVNFQQVFGD